MGGPGSGRGDQPRVMMTDGHRDAISQSNRRIDHVERLRAAQKRKDDRRAEAMRRSEEGR